MVYVIEMDVRIPETWSGEKIADYITREKETSQKWQKSGKWIYLWRVAGKYSNISVLEVESPDELHKIISSLPLFPYMTIKVTSITKHPNAVKELLI
ncbi:muconolactone Delta-isomerase family protein [Chryseobacterium sp. JM1]|uniref:muconolactone Delta-isomerase family protein n=1 Tax=Chryseobacterium sp. JM1 TaxID=1233950 RepID=UPI0004E794E8|nr:muconolactone Delta-isomerase family protein [Chryseobacterium sp. JM1]KFF21345.1 muconolactone delta-isomerase [Chryseobacterium sp. JM1]